MGYKRRDPGEDRSFMDEGFEQLELPHTSHDIFSPRYEFGRFYFPSQHEVMVNIIYDRLELQYDEQLRGIRNFLKGEFQDYDRLSFSEMPSEGAFSHVQFTPGLEEVISRFSKEHEQRHLRVQAEIKVAVGVVQRGDQRTRPHTLEKGRASLHGSRR